MPIYEYKCDDCGHQFELLQKFSDPPAKKCPSCNRKKVRKLVSAAAFHLKGTGWYVTDFRDKAKGEQGSKKIEPSAEVKADKKSAPVKRDADTKSPDKKSAGKKTADSSSHTVASKVD